MATCKSTPANHGPEKYAVGLTSAQFEAAHRASRQASGILAALTQVPKGTLHDRDIDNSLWAAADLAVQLDKVIEAAEDQRLSSGATALRAPTEAASETSIRGELLTIASKLNSCLQLVHAIVEDTVEDTVAAAELIEDVLRQQYECIDELTGKVAS